MKNKNASKSHYHKLTSIISVPVVCVLCNQYQSKYEIICPDCLQLFRTIHHACSICMRPLENISLSTCNSCAQNKPFFDKVYTAYLYEEPLKTLLQQFKYNNTLYLTKLLIKLMLQAHIPYDQIGCIVPVPLSKKSLQKRGYNQTAILTKKLTKILRVKCYYSHLSKVIHTKNQANMDKITRQKNLNNVFRCKKIPQNTITIVDDILTTGSTANEIAKTLKKHTNIQTVNVWCCARAY